MTKAASVLFGLLYWFAGGRKNTKRLTIERKAELINKLWFKDKTATNILPKQPSIKSIRRVLLLAERLQ